jgi:transcription antitermination factor NusG
MVTSLGLQTYSCELARPLLAAERLSEEANRKWYAVYTMPRSEQSVAKHLEVCQIEAYLPTCERTHIWKNRQRVKIIQPLFPSYLFVRIQNTERSKVLRAPSALQIVGNCQGPSPIADAEIEFLRSDFCRHRVEPYQELVIGKKVRIKNGPMQGVQGVLVQKRNSLRFVLTIELINQCAAVEVSADELEAVLN